MDEQIPISPAARADEIDQDGLHQLLPDVAYKRLAIVNVAFVGAKGAGDRKWVLVDAAIPGSAHAIAEAAEQHFGKGARPVAIVMTHGHFDHVGALKELADRWDAPIFAHRLEQPYLNGTAAYPPPDPTVGGGMMAATSGLFPRGPIDVSNRLHVLPDDGSVPGMPGWRWIHTPGHAPGHVSLCRDADRTLIVGDAFVTTKQESVYAVATQRPEMHGPPMYFTPDWPSARASVERLAALEPELAITGHGRAMQGAPMRDALHRLAAEFDQVAVPKHGRYVGDSARANETGPTYVPPRH